MVQISGSFKKNFLNGYKEKLNYIKFNKKITWMYVKKKKKCKYMKYNHLFLLTKKSCGRNITLIFVIKCIFVGLNFIVVIIFLVFLKRLRIIFGGQNYL